jgi:hypothetical protein
MIHYSLLVLILMSSFYPLPWIRPAISAIMVMLSIFFYWMNIQLISGIMVSKLNDEIDVVMAWSNGIIRIAAVGTLAMSPDPYVLAALFALPWVFISMSCDILATLVKWEFIQIQDRED